MLSFIYRLVRDFEKEHGLQPNLLYLNPVHLSRLREQLASDGQDETRVSLPGMEIIVSREVIHPHVAWSHMPWQRKVG